MSTEYGISLAVGFVSGLMFFVARLRRHFELHPEYARKIVHVGSGLMAMALPWMFESSGPVVVACLICAGFVSACRHTSLLPVSVRQVLGGVERRSGGEYYFPLAVAILFVVARGNLTLYLLPLAALTFADTAAAIVGTRFGVTRYPALAGEKSVEGSLAFLFVAAPVAVMLLSILSELGPGQVLVVAGWLAVTTTLAEAISTRGTDNLTVPLVAFVVLTVLLGERAYAPGILAVLLVTPAVVLWWVRRRREVATAIRGRHRTHAGRFRPNRCVTHAGAGRPCRHTPRVTTEESPCACAPSSSPCSS